MMYIKNDLLSDPREKINVTGKHTANSPRDNTKLPLCTETGQSLLVEEHFQ